MIRLYQANNAILVSFDKNANLGNLDLKQLLNEMYKKLKFPFANIIVDLKNIDDIDSNGLAVMRQGHLLSRLNQGQLSFFNANDKVLSKLHLQHSRRQLFVCDSLAMVS